MFRVVRLTVECGKVTFRSNYVCDFYYERADIIYSELKIIAEDTYKQPTYLLLNKTNEQIV